MQNKIIKARFYQAIEINGALETYIIAAEYMKERRDGKMNNKLELVDKGLLITTPKEMLIVSWNNLAAVYFDKEATITQEAPKPKKDAKTDFRNI